MKQLFKIIVSVVLIIGISSAALATDDIRISLLRDGDDLLPSPESIFFTRYTPWLKSMHIVSPSQAEANIMGGESCQQIRCINISPIDNKLILAGSDTSGVWVTRNGGEHWYNINRNIHATDIADVLCHPENPDIFFAYTKTSHYKYDDNIPGIYRSIDGGRTWERTLSDFISTTKCDRLFAYDDNGDIYAVTGKGIVKAVNDGASWEVIKSCEEVADHEHTAPATSINISPDGNTIVACYSGTSHSLAGINIGTKSNGVWTWSKRKIAQNASVIALSVKEYSPLTMVASYYDATSNKYRLALTLDGGENWTNFKDSGGTAYTRVNTSDPICKIQFAGDFLYVVYDTVDKAFRYLPVSELGRASSTTAWVAVDLRAEYADTPDSFTNISNMYIAAGFDVCDEFIIVFGSGINKYNFITKKWARCSGGYSGLSVCHFNMDDNGNMILSRVDGNIVVSDTPYTKNSPATFIGMPGAGRTHATMTVKDPFDKEGDHYICWNGNSNSTKSKVGIIITEDGGNTYVDENGKVLTTTEDNNKYYPNRVSDPKGKNTHVLEYVTIPEDKTYVYSSCARSGDNGTTWDMLPYFLLDICDNEPNKMMAWDVYGSNPSFHIMYSDDYGVTWSDLYHSSYTDGFSDEVEGFFDLTDSNRFYMISNWSLSLIDISNKTAVTKSNGFGEGNAVLRQNPKFPNHFLLGTKNFDTKHSPTLLESLDGGESWHVVPGVFGARDIKEIQFSKTTNEAFLGSHNGTIVYEYDNFWHYLRAELTDGNESEKLLFDVKRDAFGELYIVAPEKKFDTGQDLFTGWIYRGKFYSPGEKIYIK